MEKRVLIAFLLSIAVLMVYGLLFPAPKSLPVKEPETRAEAQGQEKGEPAAVEAQPATSGSGKSVLVPAPLATEKKVLVDTSLFTAVISSRGGVITSYRLKKYTDAQDRPVEMAYFEDGVRPLLLVPEGMDPDAAGMLDYEIDGGDMSLTDGGSGRLALRYDSGRGVSIVKELGFTDGAYVVDLDVRTAGIGPYELLMGESFGSLVPRKDKGYGHTGFITMVDGSKEKDDSEDVEGVLKYTGSSGWVCVTDKYFMAAAVPKDGLDAVLYKGVSDWGYAGLEAEGDSGFVVYAGPKEYDRLKAAGHGLDQAVDFGWFTFIAKPLFVALKFFHGLVGNYGWSIIIITVIIKLLFAPLTHKQQKSMRRMQKLQPKINELKEKFKGDSQKMNMEMMELYKREKVNPLGGCLPMVIQIPVFIALYNVLGNAIELRHAPFALWLTDLSAKDPYYILPVVMGVSMFAMQKMTPTTMDPKQAKIMMIMPVVLTFMFINLPSGLVLYFTLSNILSMAQQLYINKTLKD